MADRDDAPPAAAVHTGAAILDHPNVFMGGPSHGSKRNVERVLHGFRTLPDADLWRLIGWLADGLEPTREMVEAGAIQINVAMGDGTGDAADCITAALAAARETRDE